MKTSYKILWIDDDPKLIIEQESEIGEFLEDYGIEPKISTIEQVDDDLNPIKDQINDVELDIIMIDYKMGETTGDRIIEQIRTNNQYLPVIFYSSAVEIKKLFETVAKSQLDGVYIAPRSNLTAKAKSVIKSLIKKEQTTKRTRGLLLEGVSEIDARVSELIFDLWTRVSQQEKREVYESVNREGNRRQRSRRQPSIPRSFEEFEGHISRNEHFEQPYTVYTRCLIALKLLEICEKPQCRIEILNKFIQGEPGNKSLNKLRNDYAHKTRDQLAQCHSRQRCIDIRRKLREQFENIEKLRCRSTT